MTLNKPKKNHFLLYLTIYLLSNFIFAHLAWANDESNSGNANSTPNAIPVYQRPFTYAAQDKEFWNDFQDLLLKKNFDGIYSVIKSRLSNYPPDSLYFYESKLALAETYAAEKLPWLSLNMLYEIIRTRPGTNLSFEALLTLEKLIKLYPIDDEPMVQEILYEIDLESPPAEIRNFLSYFNGHYNLEKGFSTWAESDFKKIAPDSYWDFKIRYNSILRLVKLGQIDAAAEQLLELSKNPAAPPDLQNQAKHNYARILFEKGDFPKAYQILKTVNTPLIEWSSLLMERAWSKYYVKDYAKSLGLLTALESPLFDPSRTPEMYVLKMLIYKELCYYDAAINVMTDFQKRYKQSLTAIKDRKDLRNDPMLINMTLNDKEARRWIEFYNLVKNEKEVFLEKKLNKEIATKALWPIYDLKLDEIRSRLRLVLKEKVRKNANELLDWEDQLSFLDYQTKVDNLKIQRPTDEVLFKPESISTTKFEKIYWIFSGEFWLDEIENLKVFVESQCGKYEVPR